MIQPNEPLLKFKFAFIQYEIVLRKICYYGNNSLKTQFFKLIMIGLI